MKNKDQIRTWIEVDTRALAQNYRSLRRRIGSTVKLMAVVKSNAYGHGLVDFAQAVVKLGVDWLGVDSIVEAIALRKVGVKKDILVLGYTQPANFSLATRHQITLAISTLDSLHQLLSLKRPPLFHLKLDTGMHRQGFLPEAMPEVISILSNFPEAKKYFKGIFSHLAASSSSKYRQDTKHQIKIFEDILNKLEEAGFPRESLLKHLSASGGLIGYPEAHYDLVRSGISIYGVWPSSEWREIYGGKNGFKLSPVLSWWTIISEIKVLPTGGGVGYNFTEVVSAGTKLAVCPIGYWHGFPRLLSGVGEVLIRNQRAKVIGLVSMDMIVVDVTRIKGVTTGDPVTLIGKNLPAEDLAQKIGTSPYEIITRLNPLIHKFYV